MYQHGVPHSCHNRTYTVQETTEHFAESAQENNADEFEVDVASTEASSIEHVIAASDTTDANGNVDATNDADTAGGADEDLPEASTAAVDFDGIDEANGAVAAMESDVASGQAVDATTDNNALSGAEWEESRDEAGTTDTTNITSTNETPITATEGEDAAGNTDDAAANYDNTLNDTEHDYTGADADTTADTTTTTYDETATTAVDTEGEDPDQPADDAALDREGWEAHDDGEGNIYYWNRNTQESTWVRPMLKILQAKSVLRAFQSTSANDTNTDDNTQADADAETGDDADKEPPLPENWEIHHDESGYVFYWNRVTEESQWTRPEAPPVKIIPKEEPKVDADSIMLEFGSQAGQVATDNNEPLPCPEGFDPTEWADLDRDIQVCVCE